MLNKAILSAEYILHSEEMSNVFHTALNSRMSSSEGKNIGEHERDFNVKRVFRTSKNVKERKEEMTKNVILMYNNARRGLMSTL